MERACYRLSLVRIGCPHILYDQGCRLNAASWRVDSTITTVAGNQLAIAGAGAYPDGYFAGGMLLAGSEYRLITAHAGTSITLVDAVPAALAGGAVSLWPGCDRSTSTCNSRFNNLDNYGGLPFLPKKNPFSGDALV